MGIVAGGAITRAACAGFTSTSPLTSCSVLIFASGVPTGTLVPMSTRNCSTSPVSKISISIAPFCVSTTAMMSPCLTRSPGLTNHSTSVPASISEPSEGMRNSAIASPSCSPDGHFGRCDDFCRLRDCSLLEVARIGYRYLFTANAAEGRVESPRTSVRQYARKFPLRYCHCASLHRR